MPTAVYRSSCHSKHSCPQCDFNLCPLTPQSDALTTRLLRPVLFRMILWQMYVRIQQRPFNGLWSGTTRVDRYQKKHSPTHTHPDQHASFITFLHFQRSMASSLFNLRAWQSSRTTSFQVFFGLPLGLEPPTSYSIHFFTQPSSSFRNTWPYQCSLFCCSTNAMSSTPSLSLGYKMWIKFRLCCGLSLN